MIDFMMLIILLVLNAVASRVANRVPAGPRTVLYGCASATYVLFLAIGWGAWWLRGFMACFVAFAAWSTHEAFNDWEMEG